MSDEEATGGKNGKRSRNRKAAWEAGYEKGKEEAAELKRTIERLENDLQRVKAQNADLVRRLTPTPIIH